MWRSLPLLNRTGSEIFDRLFRQHSISTLLESPPKNGEKSTLTRYSICAGKAQEIDGKPQIFTPPVGQILDCLRGLLAEPSNDLSVNDIPNDIPFVGGWLGWLGYELAWEIERLPDRKNDPLPFPVAYWYAPESFAVLDHWEDKLYIWAESITDLDRLESDLDRVNIRDYSRSSDPSPASDLKFFTSATEYQKAILQAQKYIQAGDIFQANLSLRFTTQTHLDSWQIYQQLHQINPSPFASYWQTPLGSVISCSPERLVQVQDRQAQTRPIAGTRKRGENLERDRALATELLTNKKEIAEHIMLVDLERNDLGRVCRWGSVEVDELLTIERYSHVMHLVSNVRGELATDVDAIDLIRAMFPGGTITGCPKVRCMEIIAELEPFPRNLFYGSCGYLDRRGYLDLNILIRTLLYHRGQVWGQVGAGIVADSNPQQEWYESLQKAAAQMAALGITPNRS
jgi:para-aminobenzoate synthetase component 1